MGETLGQPPSLRPGHDRKTDRAAKKKLHKLSQAPKNLARWPATRCPHYNHRLGFVFT